MREQERLSVKKLRSAFKSHRGETRRIAQNEYHNTYAGLAGHTGFRGRQPWPQWSRTVAEYVSQLSAFDSLKSLPKKLVAKCDAYDRGERGPVSVLDLAGLASAHTIDPRIASVGVVLPFEPVRNLQGNYRDTKEMIEEISNALFPTHPNQTLIKKDVLGRETINELRKYLKNTGTNRFSAIFLSPGDGLISDDANQYSIAAFKRLMHVLPTILESDGECIITMRRSSNPNFIQLIRKWRDTASLESEGLTIEEAENTLANMKQVSFRITHSKVN